MKIKSTGRLAFALAIGLLAAFTAASPATAGDQATVGNPFDISRNLSVGPAANDQASDNASAANQEAQPVAAPQAAQQSAAMTEQADSSSPAPSAQAAASDDNGGWDTTALIGKVLIGVGTLLTLGSAARMLMT